MAKWTKGLKIDTENDCIISWNQKRTCFNNLSKVTGSIMFCYKELTIEENCITDIILNMELKYFMTSTHSGDIFVWKFQQHKKLIHTYTGHFREVTSLTKHPSDNSMFVSASLDGTIRFWSLDVSQFSVLTCL